jgi:hypothetical protein
MLRPALLAIAVSSILARPALAEDKPLEVDALYDTIAADLTNGKPLVIQVHVPLCESSIIRCGNAKLGDGDNPDTNLYWSTSGGFKGWFKKSRGWKLVHREKPTEGDVLEKRVWRRRFKPTASWRKRGVKKTFDAYVVAYAWRGTSINKAIDSYVDQLSGLRAETLTVDDDSTLDVGGSAHVISYVGHNGWMDIDFDWDKRKRAKSPKGTIAVACMTADYLAEPLTDPKVVPLLMTTSLMFAGAHSFEGAVSAMAQAKTLRQVRSAAAVNHSEGQGKPYKRVIGAFTNPSDKRWRRYAKPTK